MEQELIKKIQTGYNITPKEALSLYDYPLEALLYVAKSVHDHFRDQHFDLCTIVNGKNGLCSEDCKFCAQSGHFPCQLQTHGLLDSKTILSDAQRVEASGVKRYSIVTSGKKPSQNELDRLCKTYKTLNEKTGLSLCASHGLLEESDLIKLKAAGVRRIHNNLESSRSYFKKICTTHSYDDKIRTIRSAQRVGLDVCSGGIIGMGESRKDRIDLAFELKALKITSVPINLFNPVGQTPLSILNVLPETEFYKTCALFRLVLPKAVIRLAGGRGLLSDKGRRVFETCVNGSITGELLTTTGNDTKMDIEMTKELGYEI